MPYTIQPGREIEGGRVSEGVMFDLTKGLPTEQEILEASKIVARGMATLENDGGNPWLAFDGCLLSLKVHG